VGASELCGGNIEGEEGMDVMKREKEERREREMCSSDDWWLI
jgi:hypothetical protein